MLICLEGLDAAGKATQAALLANALGAPLQDFPNYESPTGKAIRGLLTGQWCVDVGEADPNTRALVLQALFTINRLELLRPLQHYAAHPLRHLVLDRYYPSGLVYGSADGLDLSYLLAIHQGLPPADLWFLLDIPPEVSVARRPYRRDEYERRAGFASKVRQGYLELFRRAKELQLGGRWEVLDGDRGVQEVHQLLLSAVRAHLGALPRESQGHGPRK